jgi:hypothetical protein
MKQGIFGNPTRREPWVWVRRLAIFETDEAAAPIRDIKFEKGLNIVWAQEPDEEAADAEISGHSAGKTSLCRLIRYVLGEKQFATKANTRLIGRAFPSGYVGAELIIHNKPWAVIRPLKKGRYSYLKERSTIEEVFADRSLSAFENDYSEKLGLTALLSDLPSATIIESGQAIKWEHLLAWCARDQEMRFQDVFGWRSPRSESDWSPFEHPKADALFLIRAILGLFLPAELLKEEALGGMKREKERLERRVADLEKEPQFRVNLYDRDLRYRLSELLPEVSGIEQMPLQSGDALGLFADLEGLAKKAAQKIQDEIQTVENDARDAQGKMDHASGQTRGLELQHQTLNSIMELESKATTEITSGPEEREQIRKQIDQTANLECPYGNILFSECDYVKKRRATLMTSELQDAHAVEQNEAKRAEAVAKLNQQKQTITEKIEALQAEAAKAKRARDGYFASVREKRETVRDLNQSISNLKFWTEKKSNPGEFKDLEGVRLQLKQKTEEITATENQLNVLIQQHNANQQSLDSIFSTAVKRVLTSGTYDGKVSLTERQLQFSITHGPSMSGEAVETLAVLLADISCLIYNAQNERSRMPGFLLHDSPREADLGKRIYWSFLRFAASLQAAFPTPADCPFQYIVTTTTEPPTELQTDKWVRVRLDAAKTNELLFRRNIATATDIEPPELFENAAP